MGKAKSLNSRSRQGAPVEALSKARFEFRWEDQFNLLLAEKEAGMAEMSEKFKASGNALYVAES